MNINSPRVPVTTEALARFGLEADDIRRHLPDFLTEPIPLRCGWLKRLGLGLLLWVFGRLAVLILRPRRERPGSLDRAEVDRVYDREAAGYDAKHHLTTRGQDTHWRRWTAWNVANLARQSPGRLLRVLDLCTGTGLTIAEMLVILRHWGLRADVTGLDFNREMLRVAAGKNLGGPKDGPVRFVRGDAMGLCGQTDADFERYHDGSFDAVTQMFGIGGICNPCKVFDGTLRLLQPGGRYLMIDMHQPIVGQGREMPWAFKWRSWPVFETLAYFQCVVPVALNRLWGWRDTTMDFYLLPLTAYEDGSGACWGFLTVEFSMESERWWLGLPFMPTARIVAEKVPISREEMEKRTRVKTFILAQMQARP